jgi:hypothetical protein
MKKLPVSCLILAVLGAMLFFLSCGGEDNETKDTPVIPLGECADCHDEAQASRRQVLENLGDGLGDFAMNSPHVMGTVLRTDCETCHYLGTHGNGVVKFLDPDLGAGQIYVYDPDDPAGIEGFCLACHDEDGAAFGLGQTPFSDGATVTAIADSLWSAAAHAARGYSLWGGRPLTCLGDGLASGCHGNGHGSDSIKLLNLDAGLSLDELCLNCHTDGGVRNDALSNNRPGGYVSADDIAEAMNKSTKHSMAVTFGVGGNTFTLQCTTCHNPHVVSGKYWDGGADVTPVSRPDFTDPLNNPRAMGSLPWGDEPGEKMDDFAAQAYGSGGWYHSVARGGVISMDQPAIYQPPLSGSGYSFEFAGNILADYVTFCLDCHTYRMSAANPPVNWGQGVTCTDNSVDPPEQRIECGADHGLGLGGNPIYMTDTSPLGANNNPDPVFSVAGVTKGRGVGHYMRWPYETAQRSAGINFVMSCTDCHESHGSDRGGMIRERLNVNANGDCGSGGNTDPDGESCTDGSNWNSLCNACHYYYGGQHEDMSCGNASCHEANSIHRIIHTTESGSTSLWTEPGRPATTPEISSIAGTRDSYQLTVGFTQGVWTQSGQSGALVPEDFLLTDVNGDNPRTIDSVFHTAGAATAVLTMSAPLISSDAGSDLVATKGLSIWDADGDPAGPWPVLINAP